MRGHFVSRYWVKPLSFFGNFRSLFETFLNWSHKKQNPPQFRSNEQSPSMPVIGLGQASGATRGPAANHNYYRPIL